MASRKGWESLSAPVRRRYERGGIDRTAYESGASLKAVRGHARGEGHRARHYEHPDTGHAGWIVGGAGVGRRELDPSDLRAMARRMPAEGRHTLAFYVAGLAQGQSTVIRGETEVHAQWIGTRLERRELERAARRVSREGWTMNDAVGTMVQQLNGPPQGVFGIAYKEH